MHESQQISHQHPPFPYRVHTQNKKIKRKIICPFHGLTGRPQIAATGKNDSISRVMLPNFHKMKWKMPIWVNNFSRRKIVVPPQGIRYLQSNIHELSKENLSDRTVPHHCTMKCNHYSDSVIHGEEDVDPLLTKHQIQSGKFRVHSLTWSHSYSVAYSSDDKWRVRVCESHYYQSFVFLLDLSSILSVMSLSFYQRRGRGALKGLNHSLFLAKLRGPNPFPVSSSALRYSKKRETLQLLSVVCCSFFFFSYWVLCFFFRELRVFI